MSGLNWRNYQNEFDHLTEEIRFGLTSDNTEILDIPAALIKICGDDPAVQITFLGVESYLVSFLEFLFFKAEGPYSPQFIPCAQVIRALFTSSDALVRLINHNAPDALANMVLQKRGKLKFAIADSLELSFILQWWSRFGLNSVSRREIYEAIHNKQTISHRLANHDPGLILRLLEVFPEYQHEFCPENLSFDDLVQNQDKIVPLPSHKRYRSLYTHMINQGETIYSVIAQEEMRILPIQVRRNTFLSFLVKQLHEERCQICKALFSPPGSTLVTVHHIIPLSEGGQDIASNMLVVCSNHHHAIHSGMIEIKPGDPIEIRFLNHLFLIEPNRTSKP
jgi:hypothetical protein